MRNINIPWPKFNLFWKWSAYINIPNLRLFLSCVLKKMPGNRKFGSVSLSQNTAKMRKIKRRWSKSNQFSRWWSGYTSMSNFQPFKGTTKKGINFIFDVTTKTNWKKMPKIEICNFGRNVCSLNHLEASSWKIKSCCNNNTDEESTFHIHITYKTKWKVKFKEMAKIQQNSTRDTPLWSLLIRCVNSIVEDTQRTRLWLCP